MKAIELCEDEDIDFQQKFPVQIESNANETEREWLNSPNVTLAHAKSKGIFNQWYLWKLMFDWNIVCISVKEKHQPFRRNASLIDKSFRFYVGHSASGW